MIRSLYRLLLSLHPPAFRGEFADQMLLIFDEARESEGVLMLFVDGLASLLRQWLVRQESWQVAVAIGGALLQVTVGGAGFLFYKHSGKFPGSFPDINLPPDPQMRITLSLLLQITAGLVTGLFVMVIALSLWVRSITGKRMRLAR